MKQPIKTAKVRGKDMYEICIYYSNTSSTPSQHYESTGVKIKGYPFKGNSREFKKDIKDEDINKIEEKLTIVKKILTDYYNKNNKNDAPVSHLRERLSYTEEKVAKAPVLEVFEEFRKKEKHKGHPISVEAALKQFAEKKGIEFTFDQFEKDTFAKEFIDFLKNEKESKRNVSFKKEPGLANTTIIKRITVLKKFLDYCKRTKKIDLDYDNIKYELSQYKKQEKITSTGSRLIEVLSEEELSDFIKYEISESSFLTLKKYGRENIIKAKDVFVFMCLQGTCFTDTIKFNRECISGNFIDDERVKTGVPYKVYIHEHSWEILKKYDFNLKINSQTINAVIKILLKDFFNATIKDKELLYFEWYRRKGIKKVDRQRVHVSTFFSTHSGRYTYISIMIEKGVDVGELKKYVGHINSRQTRLYDKSKKPGYIINLGI